MRLALAAGRIDPRKQIAPSDPYPTLDNDVRNFVRPDHLVCFAPAETDHPSNVYDTVE
jgi:hypothetical protein